MKEEQGAPRWMELQRPRLDGRWGQSGLGARGAGQAESLQGKSGHADEGPPRTGLETQVCHRRGPGPRVRGGRMEG